MPIRLRQPSAPSTLAGNAVLERRAASTRRSAKENAMPDPKPITPGARFGHWTVIDVGLVPAGKHHRHALCECICGCRKLVESGNLISGASGSCGCLTNAKKLVRPSDRFGRLVIVKEIPHASGAIVVHSGDSHACVIAATRLKCDCAALCRATRSLAAACRGKS